MRNYSQRIGPWQREAPPKRRTSRFAPTPPSEPGDPGAEQPTNFTGSDQPLPEPSAETPAQVTTPEPPKVMTEVEEGYVSGDLIVTGPAKPDASGNKHWWCKCCCGERKRVRVDHLRDRTTVSCGCLRNEKLWLGTKERAAVKARLGETSEGADSVSVVSNGDNPSNSKDPKERIKVEGCERPGYTPLICPHGMAVSPPVEGRVYGISLECFRCHDIFTMSDLIRSWEHTLNIKIETRSSRTEREGGGVTGEHLILVGTGAKLERVAEKHDDLIEIDLGDGTTARRDKPARRTTPPGASPSVDRVEDY